jgi:hypothetical protein
MPRDIIGECADPTRVSALRVHSRHGWDPHSSAPWSSRGPGSSLSHVGSGVYRSSSTVQRAGRGAAGPQLTLCSVPTPLSIFRELPFQVAASIAESVGLRDCAISGLCASQQRVPSSPVLCAVSQAAITSLQYTSPGTRALSIGNDGSEPSSNTSLTALDTTNLTRMQALHGKPGMGFSALGIIAVVIVIIVLLVVALILRRAKRARGGAPGPRPKPLETAPKVHIDWPAPAQCYPAAMIGEALRAVRAVPGFGPLTATQRHALGETAAGLSRKYGVELRVEQLVSMRTMEIALEAQRAGIRAMRQGKSIADGVKAGTPIVEIAAKHKLPPLAVLKQALLEQGHSETQVRAMVAAPATLPGRLALEAPEVFEADLSSRLHADRAKVKSEEYEDAVETFLRVRGAQFKTEVDLRREGPPLGQPGAPHLTPDFLFTSPVNIGGTLIHWLDAKNYPMYGSRLTAKSIARQAVKYTAAFGPGAMVFSGGLMCEARVLPKKSDQPLLLDGSSIRIS